MRRREFLTTAAVAAAVPTAFGGQQGAAPGPAGTHSSTWVKLPTEPYRGKQDDVFFVDDLTGWYGNGAGKLFKTVDGGNTWTKQLDQPGTFVRALGFVSAEIGFLGNIGPDYFPNVSDPNPLYRTRDGGQTWEVVEIAGPAIKGVCAIDVYREPFINAGVLDHKITLRAAGRVGGPAFMATSRDAGETWTSEDLSAHTAMILDVHFISEQVGFICGATSAKVQESNALILRTDDGGRTWVKVYQSRRPWELTWKMSWPSDTTGYVTIQSYDSAAAASQRYVAKSDDGGLTWVELPLVDDIRVREFGVGFMDENRGWIGAAPRGFETTDGGATWSEADFGVAVNKVRVVSRGAGGKAVFAIGAELHRLDLPQ